MWRRTAGVLTLAATAVACLADSHPPDAGDGSLGLLDVTIVNGAGAPRRDRVNILIRDGRIVSIGPDRLPPGIPEHRVVRGGFVIPGLIDQHAHAAIRPVTGPGRIAGRADWNLSREALELLVRFGITTIRNPEAPIPDGTHLRQAVDAWSLIGPDVFTAGPALSSGYTSTSIRAEVARQAAAAVDWIKLGTGLSPATVRAAIDEAHARGLKVVGHLQRTTWTDAARAGIDALTHGAPWSAAYVPASRRPHYAATMLGRLDWLEWVDLDGEPIAGMVQALVKHRVVVDPTLIAYDTKFRGDDPRYLRSPDLQLAPRRMLDGWSVGTFTGGWTEADHRRGHRLWPKVLGLVYRYWKAGVHLTTGSDFPNPWVVPGASLHTELELLVSAGIPPLEVLAMATSRGARALGVDGDRGTIETGKRADLVWLSADPSADIRKTRAIKGVMKQGRWVYRP